MKSFIGFWLISILLVLNLNAQDSAPNVDSRFPVISFLQDTIDLGSMKVGQQKSMQFEFINTGDAPLDIELVTACKCASLSWPQDKVPAGGKASVFVTFDSTGYEGDVLKVVDIISNTDPIVVEAWFKVEVISTD